MNTDTTRHSTPQHGRLRRLLRRHKRAGERGQALVEFAFVAVMFFILVFGIIDFGLGLHSWITVTNAAREGARLGAVHATEAEIIAATRDAARNLDQSDLTVTVTNADPNGDFVGEPVTVQVDYTYDLITPLAGILNLSTINISSTSEMRLE